MIGNKGDHFGSAVERHGCIGSRRHSGNVERSHTGVIGEQDGLRNRKCDVLVGAHDVTVSDRGSPGAAAATSARSRIAAAGGYCDVDSVLLEHGRRCIRVNTTRTVVANVKTLVSQGDTEEVRGRGIAIMLVNQLAGINIFLCKAPPHAQGHAVQQQETARWRCFNTVKQRGVIGVNIVPVQHNQWSS